MYPQYHNVSVRLTNEDKQKLDDLVSKLSSKSIVGKMSISDTIRYCIKKVSQEELNDSDETK